MSLVSITFNNPISPIGPKAPGPQTMPGKPQEKLTPDQERRQKEKSRLLLQKTDIERKLKLVKCARQIVKNYTLTLKHAAPTAPAVDPNKDPQYLFQQVRPLLSKMNLANVTDGSKTELVIGKTKGKDSLYQVTLRRPAVILEDHIERIKRLSKNFDSMQWSSQAIRVFVWYPYVAKAQTLAPGAPGAPSPVPGPGQ